MSKKNVIWKYSPTPVAYEESLEFMESHVNGMIEGAKDPCIWFLEHQPVYTLGTGTQVGDALEEGSIPILKTSRGGRSTYHGPGQRVVYLMLNLKKQCPDIHHFVWSLEEWVIQTLARISIDGFRREGRVGIWVNHPTKGESKIAAIGLRMRKWVSFHGMSLNVTPNLDHYQGIVPCGIERFGVTSLKDLGVDILMKDLDSMLKETFQDVLLPCLSAHSKKPNQV